MSFQSLFQSFNDTQSGFNWLLVIFGTLMADQSQNHKKNMVVEVALKLFSAFL